MILGLLLSVACRDGQAPDSGGEAAELIETERIQCARPADRTELGPFERPELGEPWTSQLTDPKMAEKRRDSAGIAVADLTGDGRYEIILPNKSTSFVFRLEPDGSMVDLSDEILPDREENQFWGASAADIDGDGDMDLFMQAVGLHNQVYINDGQGAMQSQLLMDDELSRIYASKGSAWGDMDGDGDLDLIVSNETSTTDEAFYNPPDDGPPNHIYENLGDLEFELREDILGHEANYGYTFLSAWLDVDNDFDQDLYLVNAFGQKVYPNSLLMNQGGGTFEHAPEDNPLQLAMDGMGLGVGDLNHDGYPDLLVTDWGRLFMMESLDGQSWYDTAPAKGLSLDPEGDRIIAWGAELQDIDNDADLDAIVAFGLSYRALRKNKEQPLEQPDAIWLQDESGQFIQVADDWGMGDTGGGRGFVLVDLNDDGFLDLVKRELYEPATLYLSRCSDANWLKIRLSHPSPNTYAVGARVVVETDGFEQPRWVMAGGTGLGSAGPLELHFGLGEASMVDRLTVHWPDGSTSWFSDIPSNQRVWVLRDGDRSVPAIPD